MALKDYIGYLSDVERERFKQSDDFKKLEMLKHKKGLYEDKEIIKNYTHEDANLILCKLVGLISKRLYKIEQKLDYLLKNK